MVEVNLWNISSIVKDRLLKIRKKALTIHSKPFGYTPLLTAVHADHESCFEIIFKYLSINPEYINTSCIAKSEGFASQKGYVTF